MSRTTFDHFVRHALAAATLVAAAACNDAVSPDQQLQKKAPAAPAKLYDVEISRFDFVPLSGTSYNVNWAGSPLRDPYYSELKHFVPVISVTRLTEPVTLLFYVMEDRTIIDDVILGELWVDLTPATASSAATTTFRYRNYLTDPGRVPRPANAPTWTTGSFWLGCTARYGRLFGNYDYGDDGYAPVYLWSTSVAIGATVNLPHVSPMHVVRCV